jgi:hypothetical protein
MGLIETYVGDGFVAHERSFVTDPEFQVTGDTTIVLDARDAEPIEVDPEGRLEAAPRDSTTVSYYRAGEESGAQGVLFLGPSWPTYSATPTERVRQGEFEFFSHWRLGKPEITATVTEPVEQEIDPLYLIESPLLDGTLERRLVYAGEGSAEEFANVDAKGAIALVRWGGPWLDAKEANARAAGAVAVIIANAVPGQIDNYGVGPNAQIPTLKISKEDGDRLVRLLETDDVTTRLVGNRNSPHLYELVLPEVGRISSDLHYDVDRGALATVHNRIHSDVARDRPELRNVWRPWMVTSVVFVHDGFAPYERTDYLVAGDTRYAQRIDDMDEPITTYRPREARSPAWWRPVLRPGAPLTVSGTSGAAYREGDRVRLQLTEWVDADGHWAPNRGDVDTTAFRFLENGALVAQATRPLGTFTLSPGPAEYRLELDVARNADWWQTSTATRTAWTVQSDGTTRAPQTLPLLSLDYDIDVDLTNTVDPRRGQQIIGVNVSHIPNAASPRIDSLRVWTSYDDGQTWQQRQAVRVGHDEYKVIAPRPTLRDGGFASIRAVATDTDGNRIEQEVIRAWRLPASR